MTKALTVRRIETVQATSSRQEIPDGLLTGLYLIVQPSGARSFAVRYRYAGQPRKLTLGAFPAINLETARTLGAKALRAAAVGRDPATEKREAKADAQRRAAEETRGQRDIYESVAREFIQRHAMKNTRETTWRETIRVLGFKLSDGELVEAGGDVMDAFKGRKVQDITKRDIVALLDTIHDRAPIMANRTLAVIRRLYTWAASRDIVEASPCSMIDPPAQEHSRDRVLTDDELRLFWNAAAADGWPYGPIFQLMALTGQREGEVAGMRWGEIDLEKKLWTLPASRVKNDEEHAVPLSDSAVEIIKSLPRIKSDGGFVFIGRRGKPVSSFSRAQDQINVAITKANKGKSLPAWVPHDLRRTVASGMARLGIQLPVIEKVLNHRSGSFRGIVAVYQRHSFAEEKRIAIAIWASHVESAVSGQPRANVVPLHKVGAQP
jgi:integrase